MKASDYFKSMDEIEKFCESFRSQCTEAEYKTLKTVFGVGEQEGIYKELPNIGKIDISIANYIQKLNQAGLTTLASCSGLAKDHPDSDIKPGYISFAQTDKVLAIIQAVAQKLNLTWQESETYLKPSIFVKFEGGTDCEGSVMNMEETSKPERSTCCDCKDEAKEHLWEVFYEAIMELVGKG